MAAMPPTDESSKERTLHDVVELVGTDTALIVDWVSRLLDDQKAYEEMSFAHNPYGDGHAAQRILTTIREWAAETTEAKTNK